MQTELGGIAKYFIFASVLLALGNLIPFKTILFESDGKQVWNMLFVPAKRDAKIFGVTFPARLIEAISLLRSGQTELACNSADELMGLAKQFPPEHPSVAYQQNIEKLEQMFRKARLTLVPAQERSLQRIDN